MIEKWGLIIAWDIPNNCYIASVPELLACTGAGRTRREALDALEQEVEHWLRTSRELDRAEPISDTQTLEATPIKNPQPVSPIAAEPQEGAPSGSRPATTLTKGNLDLLPSSTNQGLTITIAHDLPIIFLAGEANLYNSPILKQSCSDVLDSGKHVLALDLTELKYLDASVLAVMLGAVRKCRQKDGFVLLVKSKEEFVNRMLAIIRLDSIFWMCNTLDEAIEKLDTLPVLPDQEQAARNLS